MLSIAPQILAHQFLAESYGVSEDTMRGAVQKRNRKSKQAGRSVDPLLVDCLQAFGKRDIISSSDLLSALHKLKGVKYRDLTQKQLSRRLGQMGLESKTVRPPGAKPARGFYKRDLLHVLERTL